MSQFDEFERASQWDEFAPDGPPVRAVLQTAVQTNPDQAAKAAQLAKQYKAPEDVLLRNLQNVEMIDAVNRADEKLGGSPKLSEAMRRSPFLARQAHDDIEPLAKVEKATAAQADRTVLGTVGDVGVVALKGAVGLPEAFIGLANIPTFGYAGKAAEALGIRFEDAQAFLDTLYSPAQQQANANVAEAQGFFDTLGAMLSNPSTIATTVGESAPQMLGGAALGRTILAAAPKLAPWLAAALGEGLMGAGSSAENIRQEQDDGLLSAKQVFASTMSGAGTALFGAVGGRAAARLGLGDIDTALVARGVDEASAATLKQGFITAIAKAGVSEGVFEELPQSVQEQMWQNWATDQPLGQGVGKAAAQGLLAGLTMGGGFQAVSEAGQRVQSAITQREAQTQAANDSAAKLQAAFAAAAESKLRQRNPESFRDLVQQMTESAEGAPQTIYVDAQVLNQAVQSIPEQELQQAFPGLQAQIAEALASNSTVEIPVAEVLTVAPGTPLEQVFLQNARLAPDALSLAEAQQAGEQAQQFIQQEADRVLREAADTQAWQAESEQVKQVVLEQLNTAGRFTADVNEAYASLQANFFSTMAARLGVTPRALYDRYAVKVAAQQPGQGAQVLNDTRPGALTVEGYHFSRAARPVISTAMFGTGLQGNNRDLYLEAPDKRLRKRAYFYVDKGTGITPEAGVGGIAQKAQLSNIYDADADPLRLKKGGQLAFESAVLDAGFSGYLTRMEGPVSGQVIMLGDQTIRTEPIGPATQLQGQVVPPPQARQSLGRDVIVDALQAAQGLPSGSPTLARWSEILQTRFPDVHAALQAAGVFDGDQRENLYKSDLIKRFENATEAPVYGQSGRQGGDTAFAERARALLDSKPTPALSTVGIVDGKEEAPRFANITELAAYFTKKNRAKVKDLDSPKTQAKIADAIYAETLHALTDAGNAIGWYDRKTRAALDIITEVHPELATDEQSRFAFIAILAVTSNGLRSRDNFVIAEQLYRETWKTSGRFPEAVPNGGPRGNQMGEALALLNRKVDELGWQAVRDFMASKHTAKEVRDFAGANSFFGEQATAQVPGALFLGPKLGSFFNNLYGDFSTVTMDRWFMRTMNRIRGQMLSLPASFTKNLGTLREQIQAGVDTYGVKADKILTEIAAFEQATPEQQADVLYARSKLKALQQYARARHRDYARPKDDGTGRKRSFLDRTPENYLAKNLDLAMSGSNDAPFGATDRTWVRGVMDQVQQRLQADGIEISNADLQAVLWYYEKDLYANLIGRGAQDADTEADVAEDAEAKEAEDYETAARFAVARLQREGLVAGSAGPARPGDDGQLQQGGVNGEPQQAGDRGGRYSGGGLAPLEGAPDVLGAAGPDPRLVAVAEQYARDNGIELRRQAEYVQVDEARAARIAQAYAEMQHAPNDPKVKEAYADLIRQTRAQYDALVAAGYEFTFFDDASDPYQGNPWNAMRDLRANQRMAVYGTYAGFGVGADLNIGLADPAGGENLDPDAVLAAIKNIGGDIIGSVIHTSATEPTLVIKLKNKLDDDAAYRLSEQLGQEAIAQSFEDGTGKLYGPQAANWGEYNPEFFVTADGRRATETLNPLLADTGLQWPDQNGELKPVLANDLFRAVHDAFGHGLEGAGFRARGEENAWQAHVRLFTGPAVAAITSETRGQNSWLNYGPYGERNRTAKVEDTVFAEQKTGLMPEWTWSEGRADDAQDVLAQGPRGTFNPQTLLISLNENADLSTFLHESGHFFLEVMADLASQLDAPQQIRDDMAAALQWFGVSDLATWNSYTLDQKRPHHERWAESFEQYLFEGKAPSQELQPLFRRFRSWLVNVYKSLSAFMTGRDLKVSDEIRQVFDRMLATDEQIAAAEQATGLLPDFDATNEAIEKLQARSLRDLKWTINARSRALKKLQKEAATLRKGVEAEVRAEVEAQPIYRAMQWLKKGETTDPTTGEAVKAEKGFRLNTSALAEMYPETALDRPDLAKLKGMTAKDGLHPDLVADMFGFASGDALVRSIIDAEPMASVIDGITDQRMLERHGDLATPEALEAAANEAVHNEARARSLATELKSQAEMLNERTDTGNVSKNGRKITVNAITAAAKEFAQNLAARRRIKDLKNAAWQHRSAEARAGKRWQEATAGGKTQDAVQAKRDQVLNNAAAKALQDAQAEARQILEFFRRVTKGNDEKTVERGRDPDVVNAMRAILGAYGVAPRLTKSALDYMDVVARNDPAMHAALRPSVDAAVANAKPLEELTMEELRGLNDELRAMWLLAKRSRQMEVDGNLLDIEEAGDQLVERMAEIGIPDTIPGEKRAISQREERGMKVSFAKALLSRVEQWAERMDGRFGGPFLRLVFQPVKEAADRYRSDKVKYRKRFVALLDNISTLLPPGAINAPELGYEFGGARDSGVAELLHAILHTGNDSNKRKLLLGRGWATENPDGTLDTSRWDAFLDRMHSEGKLQKAHWDFAQGVWDLLEEMKPLAQESHRKVFGRYFAEVTANTVDTPFGQYRGGYVPAQVDARIVTDAKLRTLAEGENESLAYAFPSAPSGFTKARVEYNRPLMLDLRVLAQHMDKVLLFSHMQPAVNDVRRLLSRKNVSYALDRVQPAAYEGMLIPWLNRAAKQIVETPVMGDGKISRALSALRSRAGMALMIGNVSNTIQQITGFSGAAVKVRPGLMLKATGEFVRAPKAMRETVAELSPYMRDRMLNENAALIDAVEEMLVNPSRYERAQEWTKQHSYFLQTAMDNSMSPIIWTAAYNQALEEGQSERDAARFADGVIRQTQGSTLPEDISRFESGPAYGRLFTQFYNYFNMMANTNATAVTQVIQQVGLRKGAGRLAYIALTGVLAPIWVAEAIAQAFRGGPEDEDDDGYLDDWLAAVFGLGTLRGLLAQVPLVGQAGQLVVNRFNDNPADDKFSLSPAVSLLESTVSAPSSVYKAIVEEGSAQKAVRDVAAAATMATGLPFFLAARPLGYAAGVAQGTIEPTSPADAARGLVTGTASAESRQP